jgi:hypothetical protein
MTSHKTLAIEKGIRLKAAAWIAAAALALLTGCANYQAVAEFGTESQKLSSTVSGEFGQLETICRQLADLRMVTDNIADDAPGSPVKRCDSVAQAQGRLAQVTTEVLDSYGRALLALADDKALDLSSDIKSTTAKLGSLQTSGGSAPVDAKQVGAISSILVLLADVVTQAKREEGVRRLAAAKPDVVTNAQLMRSFFTRPSSSASIAKSPYENYVFLLSERLADAQSALTETVIAKNEPLRSRELARGLKPTEAMIKQRQAGTDGGTGAKIVAAIDAWIQAADTFERDALRSNAQQLYVQLKDLRGKVIDARDSLR